MFGDRKSLCELFPSQFAQRGVVSETSVSLSHATWSDDGNSVAAAIARTTVPSPHSTMVTTAPANNNNNDNDNNSNQPPEPVVKSRTREEDDVHFNGGQGFSLADESKISPTRHHDPCMMMTEQPFMKFRVRHN